MKRNLKYFTTLVLCLLTANIVLAQNEKKIKIVMDIDENGKHISIDTLFNSHEDFQVFMKENGLDEPNIEIISGLPDLETIKMELEGMELSEEDLKELKEELNKAKIEMRHIKKEMKKSEKETDQANKELKQFWVEIEENEENGEKVIIERIHEGELDGERKMIFIQKEGEDGELSNVHILKIPCDTDNELTHGAIIIKEKESGEDDNYLSWMLSESTDEDASVSSVEKNESNESTPADYRLSVNDFKLFPNPTNNKVTVSFQLTKPGPVEIRLLDTSGRLVAEANINSESGFINQEFNIEGKSRGTYLMQIKQGDQWRHEKVILK